MEKEPIRQIEDAKIDVGNVVCAYCKKVMGNKPEINGITHACCPECLKKELESMKNMDFFNFDKNK